MNEPIEIHFFVAGIPRPGGSKRAYTFKRKDGRTGVRCTDTGKYTAKWRQNVAAAARQAYRGPLLTGPLAFAMTFYMPRANSHFGTGRNKGVLKASAPKFHTKTPDVTKLVRAAEDALTGIIWQDDSQVVRQENEKIYTKTGRIGVDILIMGAGEITCNA